MGESQTCCSCTFTPAPWGTTAGSSGAPHRSGFTACGHCFHLIPTFPWKDLDLPALLGCPFQVFSCGRGQAALGFGSCCDCVFRKQHLLPPLGIFPFGRESRQRRGRGSGGRDSPSGAELLVTPSPGSGRGQPVLPAPPSPSVPTLALGAVGSVPSGCSGSPAPLQLIAGRGDSLSCSQAAAGDSPPCSAFPGPFLPSSAGLELPWGHLPWPRVAVPRWLLCDQFDSGAGIHPLLQGVQT